MTVWLACSIVACSVLMCIADWQIERSCYRNASSGVFWSYVGAAAAVVMVLSVLLLLVVEMVTP